MLITICSGKGGVGKSVLSANIAYQLSTNGAKVLLIDNDLMFPNLHLLFSTDPALRLDDWLYQRATLNRVITSVMPNLSIIAGSITSEDGTLANDFSFTDLYHDILLDTEFDFVIVDTGAGASNAMIEAASMSDIVGLVVTDEPTSIVDAYGLTKILLEYCNQSSIKLLLNNVIDNEDAQDISNKLNLAMNHFLNLTLDLLGFVPYDINVRKSIVRQNLLSNLAPSCEATFAIKRLAKTMISLLEPQKLISTL